MDADQGLLNSHGNSRAARTTVNEPRIQREPINHLVSGAASAPHCCTSGLSAASDGGSDPPRDCDPFSRLPDELLVQILSRLSASAAAVSIAAITCRRWRALTRRVPCLSFGAAESELLPSQMRLEESISRMVLRSDSLRRLLIVSPLAAAPPGAACGGACGDRVSASQQCRGYGACAETAASSGAGKDSESSAASFSHPREFIFEAWMRHAGPSLRLFSLSRSISASNCGVSSGGDSSVVVNLWEAEDASLHLAHISRHCTSLRSLSLGHVSLSAPTLLATLQPMPALEHLSLSWFHASPDALHAVLDAAPNLRSLEFFMASGFPRLDLRLPPTVEQLSLSYVRADSVALHSADSLQSLSIRDMFLRTLSVRHAPNLRQLAVASASCLVVSAPSSTRLASIDLRADSLDWPATETLVSANSAALESLSLDFFALGSGLGRSPVSSLPWLAQNCPKLKSLQLGLLVWQNMVHSAVESSLLQPQCCNESAGTLQIAASHSEDISNIGMPSGKTVWPQLEELKLRLGEKGHENLLLLHAILANTPSLMNLHVTVVWEDEDEGDEEEDEMEHEECDAMIMDEEEVEEEGDEEEDERAVTQAPIEHLAGVFADSSSQHPTPVADPELTSSPPVHHWSGLSVAGRRKRQFLKGLDCLQRGFGCVRTTIPALFRRGTR